jgi:hypothetical protein
MARPIWRRAIGLSLAAGLMAGFGCAQKGGGPDAPRPRPSRGDAAVYHAAQTTRTEYLEREITRLRADLTQAEEAMVTIESGLRGQHTRADAVSTVADARIAVQRAAREAPWRNDDIQEARSKLEEAARQLRAGHSGSALFFASRAARIAQTLSEEADQVARAPDSRFVQSSQANLRSGPSTRNGIVTVVPRLTPVFPQRQRGDWLLVRTPSGPVGWVHDSVLEPR